MTTSNDKLVFKRRDMSQHDLVLPLESCRGHGTCFPFNCQCLHETFSFM